MLPVIPPRAVPPPTAPTVPARLMFTLPVVSTVPTLKVPAPLFVIVTVPVADVAPTVPYDTAPPVPAVFNVIFAAA